MTFHVLFVCSANVCRSPAAAALFRDGMPDVLARTVSVGDAGLAARPDTEMCVEAVSWVTRHAVSGEPPPAHRPIRLGVSRVAQSDLVVALDREVRAAVLGRVLGQVPDLRQRLFTLVEAAALAEGVAAALEAQEGPGLPGSSLLNLEPLPEHADERMTWLVAEMDAARGLVRARQHRRRFGRATEIDVHDAHGPRGSHRDTLRVLDESVHELVAAIRMVMAVAGVQPGRGEGRRIKR